MHGSNEIIKKKKLFNKFHTWPNINISFGHERYSIITGQIIYIFKKNLFLIQFFLSTIIYFLRISFDSFQTSKQGIVDPMLSIWGQQMFVNEDTDQ